MFTYKANIYRTNDSPSENDFWRLLRTYSGGSLSNPIRDDELLGEAHFTTLESKRPLTQKGLQAEFPLITIQDLKKLRETEPVF